MTDKTKIKVEYQSRYNGCTIYDVADSQRLEDEMPIKLAELEEKVAAFAYQFCDDDGEFEGDMSVVEAFAIATVKDHFGASVEVEFEEDSISS